MDRCGFTSDIREMLFQFGDSPKECPCRSAVQVRLSGKAAGIAVEDILGGAFAGGVSVGAFVIAIFAESAAPEVDLTEVGFIIIQAKVILEEGSYRLVFVNKASMRIGFRAFDLHAVIDSRLA